jgi:pimeloyl-ACP methyl ester carboxylesterase
VYDDARRSAVRAIALGDDAHRLEWLRVRLGPHAPDGWLRFKAARWRASSDRNAVAAYSDMFPKGVPQPDAMVSVPVLAVTGERDVEPMRCDAVQRDLSPICKQLVVTALMESGHYPMQETPPALIALLEQFLRARH